jgi:hypothetical protein
MKCRRGISRKWEEERRYVRKEESRWKRRIRKR